MFEVLGENLVPVSNIYRINSDATLGYLNSNLHLVETKLRVCAGQAGMEGGKEGVNLSSEFEMRLKDIRIRIIGNLCVVG